MANTDIMIDMWDRQLGLDGVVPSGDPPTQGRNFVLNSGGAFQRTAPPPTPSGATLTLTRALHGERTVVMGAATQTLTLPAATGSGARFRIVSGVAATTQKIQVANSTDYMRGQAWLIASANVGFQTANTGTVASESDTITMNGTTTGGVVGTEIELEDIAAHVWQVEIDACASGIGATPFSAAV